MGNDQSVASCSDNDTEIDVDLTVSKEGVDASILSAIQSDDRQTKNLRWTEEMDRCLGKILVEQVRNGHKIDNNLQREAYDRAVLALNEKFGPNLSKEHIRNRLRTWKKQYGILKELLSNPGFKWDEMRKMIVANDSVWDYYVKVCNFDQTLLIMIFVGLLKKHIQIDLLKSHFVARGSIYFHVYNVFE